MALWGSRFSDAMAADALDYTGSVETDLRMLRHDLWGSIVHVLMLCSCKILDDNCGRTIIAELLNMIGEAERGQMKLDPALEDVHINIEQRLIERLTLEVGGRLHTARSRNDQVVTDSRLYVREALLDIGGGLIALISSLLDCAYEQAGSLTLGYTHSQVAQPITFGFWLSAHASALLRDLRRIEQTLETVNRCPLGSCALAGTSFAINRQLTSDLLGFDGVLRHALDATSSRDYMIETASTCAILMAELSRLAEELVIWSSFEVSTLRIADAYATGSSIMPQKRNAVVAELARAKAATAFGALMEILGVTKSVAMGYSSDLQQDKPPVWRTLDLTIATIKVFVGQIRTLHVETERAEDNCWRSFATATELANHFVRNYGKPFREAYQIVGRLIQHLEANTLTLQDADVVLKWLEANGVRLSREEYVSCVDPRTVVGRQTSSGGTAPDEVRAMIGDLRDQLQSLDGQLAVIRKKVGVAFTRTHELASAFTQGKLSGSAITSAT